VCIRLAIAFLTVSFVVGCGNGNTPSQTSQTETPPDSTASDTPAGVTVAVVSTTQPAIEDGSQIGGEIPSTKQDPVATLLAEIQRLRINAGPPSQKKTDPNHEIVLKATEILKLTMQDSSRQGAFLDGIRHLLQARFQLALTGTPEDVDQLYADVQALNDRDSESDAAAEGIYYLAKFAHTKARQPNQQKADWNVNFSRWSREFAARFPQQSERGLSLLFGAGRSCEMTSATAANREDSELLRKEARLCYTMLMEKWPKEPQGHEAVAVLRRLDLPGTRLSQFSGPELTGGKVSSEQFTDKVTLIYFWDSASKDFTDNWLPLLKKAETKLTADRIRLVGVNLDEDIAQCQRAVNDLQIPGDQICFQDENNRGWNSPLVRFWGVSQSPSVWLVDHNGIVAAVDVRQDALVSQINPLLRARTASRN
jgi:hypothetical protein